MRNLTEVSLKNKDLVWYFIVVVFLAGIFSFMKLGRMEDPEFSIRTMVVTAAWPGASADRMEEQVTDKLERRFQDLPGVDHIRSFTRAGQTCIYIDLKEDLDSSKIRPSWRDLRNFGEDVKKDLPEGVYGPFYNDRFDDVYGSIYAITGDGYSYEEMRQAAEKARRLILAVPSVQKVELLGVQNEKVYVEVENAKLASLGIPPTAISNAVKTQNIVSPSAMVDTESDNVYLRITGSFDDVEAIRETPVSANGRTFRLGDIATVERRPVDPMEKSMYYNGEPAIGIAVSMEPGGNVLELGKNLNALVKKIGESQPVGLEIHRVSDQPAVVEDSISEFVSTLREAVIIVLIVSFMSLGVRTGMVVAGCIPLVLAATFCGMYLLGIDLQKVSLGSLIIALGLLVDDAIIAVEMMSVKLEEGLNRFDAACYAFRATAKPMLTGTLITCAGFIPIAFAKGMTSEFCQSMFPVIGLALLISWIVSVMVAPLFGNYLIRVKVVDALQEKKESAESRFHAIFRKTLSWCLTHKTVVLAGTAALFAVSVCMMKFIHQEFFPQSVRPEILITMRLPEGASMKATHDDSVRFAEFLNEHKEKIDNYSYYVGTGAPRFVLTIDPQADASNLAQFVIVAKDVESRTELTNLIRKELSDNFPNVQPNLQFIQTGPPATYPVMLRVSGYDKAKVRELSDEVVRRLAADGNYVDINRNWNEKTKTVHLELDQDKLRAMGISGQQLAQTLYMEVSGASIAQYYKGDRTIDIQVRLKDVDRNDLSKLKDIQVFLGAKGYVPLSQIAKISYKAEDGLIWRRDLRPTITVQANVATGTGNDGVTKALAMMQDLNDKLPLGYSIEPDGSLEDSETSMGFLLAPVPVMVLIIMTLLMVQLRNGKLMLLTLLTAPMGIIGVVFGMLLFNKALGFVAYLGILALTGMIIRNSVILIDQIQKHLADGETPWDAVVDSAILRFRPIILTAAAAILGMVPLMTSAFWGPMATAIACGLVVATVLTLLVLPTMYAAVYKVEEER